jgi:hypothetical protein
MGGYVYEHEFVDGPKEGSGFFTDTAFLATNGIQNQLGEGYFDSGQEGGYAQKWSITYGHGRRMGPTRSNDTNRL